MGGDAHLSTSSNMDGEAGGSKVRELQPPLCAVVAAMSR